jgi:hypothetical protein
MIQHGTTQVSGEAILAENVVIGPASCSRIAAVTRGRNQRN